MKEFGGGVSLAPPGSANGFGTSGSQICLISCSFWENLANLYVGAPEGWRPLLWEILGPPLVLGLQNLAPPGSPTDHSACAYKFTIGGQLWPSVCKSVKIVNLCFPTRTKKQKGNN